MKADACSISLVIVEDHTLLRDAIRALVNLNPDMRIVGEAATADEAVDVIGVHRPDVLLLDLGLPGKSGLDVARRAKQRYPRTKILVLTAHSNPQYIRAMIAAGVEGYLFKTARHEDLVAAIQAIARGETVLDSMISDSVMRAIAAGAVVRPEDLTSRELEVLRLVSAGRRNHEIAKELVVAVSTVETHVRRVLRKLGVCNRMLAVREARQRGLLLEEPLT